MDGHEELILFGKEWNKAMVNNDVEEIGRFMSDDWVIIGTDGGITSKEEFLSWVSSGDLIHTQMDGGDERVKIYGDSAVATGRGTSSGTYKGEPFSFYEWSTSMFVKQDGKWLCVLSMLTPAKKK